MTKDEMKNRISMTLKDPVLQQGFEIICKENAELDCQMNKNKYCYSCVNATDRCFRKETGCPCEKYKSYKDENAELKERLGDKDMAEIDLATVAYMQGAEQYKTKWHRLSAGDTPKENKLYLVKIKDNGLAIAYFNGQHWETRYNLGDCGHCVETVIAWCEIPKFEE